MRRCSLKPGIRHGVLHAALIFTVLTSHRVQAGAQAQATSPPAVDDSQVRPPVTETDVRIVQRAAHILDAPAKWNRADTRVCPDEAKTFSLYCALEKATKEVSGDFRHRGAAMQEARFVIDEVTHNRDYEHRLMGYNNDPATTFADVQKIFRLLQERLTRELQNPAGAGSKK